MDNDLFEQQVRYLRGHRGPFRVEPHERQHAYPGKYCVIDSGMPQRLHGKLMPLDHETAILVSDYLNNLPITFKNANR